MGVGLSITLKVLAFAIGVILEEAAKGSFNTEK